MIIYYTFDDWITAPFTGRCYFNRTTKPTLIFFSVQTMHISIDENATGRTSLTIARLT